MLAEIWIEDAVRKLRPDFAVLAMTATGLTNGPSDDVSAAWLHKAGLHAAGTGPYAETEPRAPGAQSHADRTGPAPYAGEAGAKGSAGDPHVLAWREAYRGFGAKPQRTRPSVDALLRRADRLPAVNRVVDAYNAVSVEYALPIGGEDLDAYRGTARLVRARGDEDFEITADGAPAVEHPEAGEVVWRDDHGVTCRRWNWRQCVRTRITETTGNALFLLERLEPYPLERLHAAADELAARLRAITPEVRIETRLIGDVPW